MERNAGQELENSNLRRKVQELNEECFTLRAAMIATEVEVKYNAEKEIKKLKSQLAFMSEELNSTRKRRPPQSSTSTQPTSVEPLASQTTSRSVGAGPLTHSHSHSRNQGASTSTYRTATQTPLTEGSGAGLGSGASAMDEVVPDCDDGGDHEGRFADTAACPSVPSSGSAEIGVNVSPAAPCVPITATTAPGPKCQHLGASPTAIFGDGSVLSVVLLRLRDSVGAMRVTVAHSMEGAAASPRSLPWFDSLDAAVSQPLQRLRHVVIGAAAEGRPALQEVDAGLGAIVAKVIDAAYAALVAPPRFGPALGASVAAMVGASAEVGCCVVGAVLRRGVADDGRGLQCADAYAEVFASPPTLFSGAGGHQAEVALLESCLLRWIPLCARIMAWDIGEGVPDMQLVGSVRGLLLELLAADARLQGFGVSERIVQAWSRSLLTPSKQGSWAAFAAIELRFHTDSAVLLLLHQLAQRHPTLLDAFLAEEDCPQTARSGETLRGESLIAALARNLGPAGYSEVGQIQLTELLSLLIALGEGKRADSGDRSTPREVALAVLGGSAGSRGNQVVIALVESLLAALTDCDPGLAYFPLADVSGFLLEATSSQRRPLRLVRAVSVLLDGLAAVVKDEVDTALASCEQRATVSLLAQFLHKVQLAANLRRQDNVRMSPELRALLLSPRELRNLSSLVPSFA